MFISPMDPTTIDALAASWGGLALTVAWKGMVLLAMAIALNAVLRRGAASARHLVWTGAVAGLLLLPLLGAALPGWEVPGIELPSISIGAGAGAEESSVERPVTELLNLNQVAARQATVAAAQFRPLVIDAAGNLRPVESGSWLIGEPAEPRTASTDAQRAPTAASLLGDVARSAREWSAWTWALLVWESGVLLVFAWLSIGWWHLRALQRRSHPVTDPRWLRLAEHVAGELGLRRVPRLVRTADAMTPLTWGVWRPVVLVPAPADRWSEAQRIDVLRHEFAHVQRRDVLTQFLAQLGCALMWFHPLPWIAAARMRLERERACDDRVLLAGSRASSYAGHLLDMARSLRSEHSLAAATIGMARRSQLGERMDSLLDDAPRARRLGRLARIGLCAGLVALLVPLAAMRPQATEAAVAAPPDAGRVAQVAPAPPVPPVPSVRPLRAARGTAPHVYHVGSGHGFSFGLRRGMAFSGDLEDSATNYEVDSRHSNFTLRDDDLTLEVELDGRIRFASDESDVEWMEKGAYFELEREKGRERRRMEIEADRDGELERSYFVEGRRTDIDDEARAWFAEALGQFLTHSGIGTEPRVQRWFEQDGIAGAIDHIRAIDGDFAAARHWSALLGSDALDSDDRAKVLAAIPDDLESDFEKNRVLSENLAVILGDEGVSDEVIAVIESIDSDFERRRALQTALSVEGLDEDAVERVLVLVGDMDSDFEKVEALRTFPRAMLAQERSQRAYLEALRRVDSDFERGRGLAVILDGKVDRRNAPLVMGLVDDFDSDFEKGRVLVQALPLALDDEEARQTMWRSIEAMDSDFEKARVIGALADRIQDSETMLLEALTACESIDSDFEKSRLLRHFADAAAKFPTTREKYIAVAEEIDSDHEYGQVMRALKRADR